MKQMSEMELTVALNGFESSSGVEKDKLMSRVYQDLKKMAYFRVTQMPRSNTMTPTVLVHEAFLKLFSSPIAVTDRKHFFALASCAMRQIMVDHVRKRSALKRSYLSNTTFKDEVHEIETQAELITQVDELLQEFEVSDPTLVQIIELRFFVGLTNEETAEVLNVSRRTVQRYWDKVKQAVEVQD